jgi:signal transduction histidine kinase
MTTVRVLISILIVAAATALFYVLLHQVAGLWLDLALRPEVRSALQQSLEDQKRLHQLDRGNGDLYRRRFETARTLLTRLEVIRMNREEVLRRFELALTGMFALSLAMAALVWTVWQRRNEERKRLEYVQRLRSWQEASRRHAHEIRTPLTAARFEVERLAALARSGSHHDELIRACESVVEEFDKLSRFTREFSSFGALGQPVLQRVAVEQAIAEFCEVFASAWPNLSLRCPSRRAETIVLADRDLLRQVFVNLCTNSARATEGSGNVSFRVEPAGDQVYIDVGDSGRGIAESVRARIFEPYVTTRNVGEGMGLGLAISRKILIDHGGDLSLLSTSPEGTTFRLTLPR